jgi:DNA-binding XRE family transcriptional regulator
LLTGGQIRAARAFLNWSGADLAARVELSRNTIAKIEQTDLIPSMRLQTMLDIKRAFEEAGVEFIGTPDHGPGVRLKPKESLISSYTK